MGICKPFKECSYLYNIFLTKPVSSSNIALIKDSKCHTANGITFVCCPLPRKTTPFTTTTTTTTPEPITEHPGKILIGERCSFTQFLISLRKHTVQGWQSQRRDLR